MNAKLRRYIPTFETTSLTNKFKSLWLAGIEAKLTFETRAGEAWGTLQVCLGEHPLQQQQHQQPPDPQEVPQRHESPSKQRRRERRVAARAAAAVAASDEAEKAVETEGNENETNTDGVEDLGDTSVDNVVAEEASAIQRSLLITDIDDEICNDELYYDEIDPGTAVSCLQCNMEYFPASYVDGDKVNK